ncbi:MAG: enoyl-CoA hydratase-related protein, partial [Gammaproteobacteria bacterium]
GHDLSVELDIDDAITEEAVDLWRPEVIIAPFLKRAIPERIWRHHTCLIVHPGPPGDRGPSALDWAILGNEPIWGVTVLEAEEHMDAGPIRAWRRFRMREASKGSIYRNEVTEAAVAAVREALAQQGGSPALAWRPEPGMPAEHSIWRPAMRQADRAIDWQQDDTQTVLRKIRSADGQPGLADTLLGEAVRLYDAHPATGLTGRPGELLGRRNGAICRATRDGAVWIGSLRISHAPGRAFKRPAVDALGEAGLALPELPERDGDWSDICYRETAGIGWLFFDFHNGAMSTSQCERLLGAYRDALRRPTRVLVLAGGADFWSNGLHLNVIEAADSPADESWRNINAMDDLAAAILATDDRLTVAALRGNAGAGGVFLALAADRVMARRGIILNPHYKNMGNLYGSEFWTYLLPRRIGDANALAIMQHRLPMSADDARATGLVDLVAGPSAGTFTAAVEREARRLAGPSFESQLAAKREQRTRDEAIRPLADYRREELEHMKLNFYGFDPSYHVARYRFVNHHPHAWTPLHLARHRSLNAGRTALPRGVA